MYRVETAESSSDLDEWQGFVDSQPQSHAFHHGGWFHVLKESSAVKPRFLLARDRVGTIVGILPAYLSRSVVSGSHLTTLDAGILATHPAAAKQLVHYARTFIAAHGSAYFLLRGAPSDEESDRDARCDHVLTIVDTRGTSDELLRRVKKKTRWYVRQGESQGFAVRPDPELASIDAFYRLYAAHVHRLGTPVMSRRMMQVMARYLGPQRLRLLLVERNGETVGGMLMVVGNRGFHDLYALVRHDLRETSAGYLLYWRAIELASREGAVELNLGRSKVSSGTHLFKTKWGGRDEPLIYRYYFAPGTDQLDRLGKYRSGGTLAQRVWKHLPLWVANRIGPVLRRQLPFV
jgi:hypothetical protein